MTATVAQKPVCGDMSAEVGPSGRSVSGTYANGLVDGLDVVVVVVGVASGRLAQAG